MKVRFINDIHAGNKGRLTLGKEYDVIGYRDEEAHGISYEIIDDNNNPFWLRRYEIETPSVDPIVQRVIDKFQERSRIGIETYGTTLQENNLSTLEWINEAQAEAMDFCLYLEKLKDKIKEYDRD